MLDKLLGGERKSFLVLSEESSTDVVIAPTRPEEPEADEAGAALEAPILFAEGVATAQPAAPQAKPAAAKGARLRWHWGHACDDCMHDAHCV